MFLVQCLKGSGEVEESRALFSSDGAARRCWALNKTMPLFLESVCSIEWRSGGDVKEVFVFCSDTLSRSFCYCATGVLLCVPFVPFLTCCSLSPQTFTFIKQPSSLAAGGDLKPQLLFVLLFCGWPALLSCLILPNGWVSHIHLSFMSYAAAWQLSQTQ